MKTVTYTKSSDAEIIAELTKKREELRTARFDIAGSRGKNTKAIQAIRHSIARLLTEHRRRSQ